MKLLQHVVQAIVIARLALLQGLYLPIALFYGKDLTGLTFAPMLQLVCCASIPIRQHAALVLLATIHVCNEEKGIPRLVGHVHVAVL